MTNHSFISSARLKITAALAAAVMLAPVTAPAIGTIAANDSTPTLRADTTKEQMTTAVSAAKTKYDSANKQISSTQFALLTKTDKTEHEDTLKDAKSRLAAVQTAANAAKDSAAFATVVTDANTLTNDLQAFITSFADKLAAPSNFAKETLHVKLREAQDLFNNLSSAQQISKDGKQLNDVIAEAKVKDSAPAVSINDVAPLLDSLNTAIELFKTPAPIPTPDPTVADVRTALDELKKTADSTSTHLRNLPAYKAANDTVGQVTKDITDGKVTTTNAATYLSDIQSKLTALEAALKRSITNTGVATINYVPGYGIQVWTWGGKIVKMDNDKSKAKKLQHGTRWKIFGDAINQNGSRMYNLGGDQFIDANFITISRK